MRAIAVRSAAIGTCHARRPHGSSRLRAASMALPRRDGEDDHDGDDGEAEERVDRGPAEPDGDDEPVQIRHQSPRTNRSVEERRGCAEALPSGWGVWGAMSGSPTQKIFLSPPKNPRGGPNCLAKTPTPVPSRST